MQTMPNNWGGGGSFKITVDITKDISNNQCWDLILQYNNPIKLAGGTNSVWNMGRLVYKNSRSKCLFDCYLDWQYCMHNCPRQLVAQ